MVATQPTTVALQKYGPLLVWETWETSSKKRTHTDLLKALEFFAK